jgi:hypothetical protein
MKLSPLLCSATLVAALALPASVVAQTLLDDYSSDLFSTHYVQKNVPGFTSGGWNVTSGQLMPDTSNTNGYVAFVWKDNALQNVGDSFTIDLHISKLAFDHNGGLAVWTSNTSTFDRVFEPRLGGHGSAYTFVSTDENGVDQVDTMDVSTLANVKLTVALADRGAGGNDAHLTATVSFVLNGSAGFFSHDYLLEGFTGPLYVGPSDWQGHGADVSFDNLTFTAASAVPEPSTFAALLGATALGLVGWRRRAAKLRAQS